MRARKRGEASAIRPVIVPPFNESLGPYVHDELSLRNLFEGFDVTLRVNEAKVNFVLKVQREGEFSKNVETESGLSRLSK